MGLYDTGKTVDNPDQFEKENSETNKKYGGCVGERACYGCGAIIADTICLCIGVFTCPRCGHKNTPNFSKVDVIIDWPDKIIDEEPKRIPMSLVPAGFDILNAQCDTIFKALDDDLFENDSIDDKISVLEQVIDYLRMEEFYEEKENKDAT